MANGKAQLVLRHIRTLAAAGRSHKLTDRQLLEQYSRGRDEEAFAALLRRHGPMILRVCQRVLGHWQDAEDVFQATFLVLARKAPTLQAKESIGTWLYEVAHRLAQDARRKRFRQRVREEKASRQPHTDQLSEITARELVEVVDEELNRLAEKYRAPLVLCCLEGRSGDEAARQLACSLSTLKRRLSRGRELLHARLTRRGLALSATALSGLLLQNTASAAVPVALADATIEAAMAYTVTGVASAVVSAQVLTLSEGVLKGMFLTKLKIAAALVIVTVIAGGAGISSVGLYGAASAEDGKAKGASSGNDAPNDEAKSAKLCATLKTSDAWVDRLEFTADGKTLAAASRDGAVKVWELPSGRQRTAFQWTKGTLIDMVITPDGKTVAVAGGSEKGEAKLWDVTTDKEQAAIKGLTRQARAVAFTPDCKTLALGLADETVRLWQVTPLRERAVLRGHAGEIQGLAFTADGGTLVSASSDKTVKLWDVATGKERATLKGHTDEVGALALASDGKFLATTSSDRTVKLWDMAEAKELATRKARDDIALSPAFVLKSKYLALVCLKVPDMDDGSVRLWDSSTGKERTILRGKGFSSFCGIAFSPDGKILATGGYGVVKLWDMSSDAPKKKTQSDTNLGPSSLGKDAKVSADGKSFEIEDLPPGQYDVLLFGPSRRVPDRPGSSTQTVIGRRPVNLKEGQTEAVEFGNLRGEKCEFCSRFF
jgi:RNA polymerase sigma factor (sigma-70 family)